MISSRTLTDGRVSRFWILWEKFWEYLDIPSGELKSDESCNGDFTDDGDLIPLALEKPKQTARSTSTKGLIPPVVYGVGGRGEYYPRCPGQPTDRLTRRTKQISTDKYYIMCSVLW